MNSISCFYNNQKQENNVEDSAIIYVKDMIGIEEEQEQEDDFNYRSNNLGISQENYRENNRKSTETPNGISNPRFTVSDKSNQNLISKNKLAITSLVYNDKSDIKEHSNDEITTLEVIINPKTNKKLKAILPKAHLRNINPDRIEKGREVALYKPTKIVQLY